MHIGGDMRRVVWLAAIFMVAAPISYAQDHVAVGVFGHFFRHGETDTNFGGLGGRLSVNAHRLVQIEAELSYDFEQVFTEGFTDPSSGAISFQQSPLRVLHGLFGPKLQSGGAAKVFATLKAGFINFQFDDADPSFGSFTSSLGDLRAENVNFTLYPGVGFEANLGIIGLRFDVGDEIYFQDGSHHNWRVTFGPQIRF
jgi:hypothetical protein